MKPEKGQIWINRYNGAKVRVLDRIFFNIKCELYPSLFTPNLQYEGIITHIHYKTFQKDWSFTGISVIEKTGSNN